MNSEDVTMFGKKSFLILAITVFGLALAPEAMAIGRGLVSPPSGPCDGAGTCTVTCGVQTIGEVLANAASGPGGKLTIIVNGDCTEDLLIERDDVTLQDGTITGTGANQPVIAVRGARRILIDNMVVQGGASDGIRAGHNADVTIINSTVQNNARYGVAMFWGAYADIEGSTITGNAQCAVGAFNGGRLYLENNPLISSAVSDIAICATVGGYRNAVIYLGGGNTITNTGGGWVMDIIQGSAVRQQNGLDVLMGAIDVDRGASVDIRSASITGNVRLTTMGQLWLRNSTLTGKITPYATSLVDFPTPLATVDGNIEQCGGSIFGVPNFGGGGGFVSCP
jgi:hypothetical protein